MSTTGRRKFLGRGAAVGAGAVAVGAGVTALPAAAQTGATKKVWHAKGAKPEPAPLFSGVVSYGNLLFLSGIGAHFEGDIKAHTKHVLDEIEKNLEMAGSSMNKVLKCSVFLADLKDYKDMNEVFRGRFGPEPPVRTTVSVAGVPGKSLVEIDVIAYI
jgi:2-iminobutanoate/2-iminopropanoate deaminase